jgi:hypothetical protein
VTAAIAPALAPFATTAVAEDAPVSLAPASAASASASGAETFLSEAPPEAPPPLPHKKGLVLESSLGVLGFGGQFRHVAPMAPWLHLTLGYEFFNWLMAYAEGELAYTDTSIAEDPSKAYAFPILGFGGGLRGTAHFTERFAAFVQGGLGALKADVPKQALFILGFRDAESFNAYFGARVGVEWYQIDRHFALGVGGGVRDATGFAKVSGSDTPLMWDASATIRYTF